MNSSDSRLAGKRPVWRLAPAVWALAAVLVSACDLWPRNLEQLAESIGRQVSGETTAWLLGGDVLVIDVAGSPAYRKAESELEALATGIAEQATAFTEAPIESIIITFHEGAVSDDPEKTREFIFLVMENRPVLQPNFAFDATGPLTLAEIQAVFGDPMTESLTPEHEECFVREVENLARTAGDPETLDPASMEFLSAETWYALDAYAKRLILAQAIMTEALFDCAERKSG